MSTDTTPLLNLASAAVQFARPNSRPAPDNSFAAPCAMYSRSKHCCGHARTIVRRSCREKKQIQMTLVGDRAILHDRLQRVPFYLNLFVALGKVQIVQVSVACSCELFVTDARDPSTMRAARYSARNIGATQPRYFKI